MTKSIIDVVPPAAAADVPRRHRDPPATRLMYVFRSARSEIVRVDIIQSCQNLIYTNVAELC